MSRRVRVAGVPGVVAAPAGIDRQAPLVVLWHGFGSPPDARELADRLPLHGLEAYRAYLDLPLFGERMPEGGPRELGERQAEDYLDRLLWPVVETAARELPDVVDGLRSELDAGFGRGLGLVGHAAGGLAALFAVAEGTLPVDAAAAVGAPSSPEAPLARIEAALGEAYEWTPEARERARRLDMVARAEEVAGGEVGPDVLLLHGGEDAVVPPSESRQLGAALREALAASPADEETDGRVRVEVVEGAGHGLPPSDHGGAGPVEGRLVEWLGERLSGPDG